MKNYFFSRILAMVFLATVSISCTSNLDFNQANNVTATPIVVANLASFDIPASQFVIGGTEQSVFSDVQNFDVFRDTFFINNLTKADLHFEVFNTINRAYSLDLELLDANNMLLYPIHIDVPQASSKIADITFVGTDLDLLKRMVKIRFTITKTSGTGLINTGSLKLRSSATVYLDIK